MGFPPLSRQAVVQVRVHQPPDQLLQPHLFVQHKGGKHGEHLHGRTSPSRRSNAAIMEPPEGIQGQPQARRGSAGSGSDRPRSKSDSTLTPPPLSALFLHGPAPGLASPPETLCGRGLGADSARLLSNASKVAREAERQRRGSLQHLVVGILGCSDGKDSRGDQNGGRVEQHDHDEQQKRRSASACNLEMLGCRPKK